MALNLMSRRALAPICSMCRERESRTRTVITEPLIDSLSVWCCDVCYPALEASVDRMKVADSSLVVTEVAA
jgi:hypothetical protein